MKFIFFARYTRVRRDTECVYAFKKNFLWFISRWRCLSGGNRIIFLSFIKSKTVSWYIVI